MKRDKPAKRRDRRSGLSPYAKHGKREFVFSASYQAWASQYRPRKASQVSQAHQ